MADNRDPSDWLKDFHPSEEENALYAKAARRSGLETAHWARQVLNAAVREWPTAEHIPISTDEES